jgi:MFS family permease
MDTPDHEDIRNVVADGAPTAGRREWMGLAVLALPCLLYSMDFTVLHLAVPHLSADLKPTSSQLLWIIDIYGFLLAGFLITIGTLGDRIGRRRLLLIGAAAFGAASLLAAFSRSAEMLIATRELLGIAAAIDPISWLAGGNSLSEVFTQDNLLFFLIAPIRTVHLAAVVAALVLMFLPSANTYFRTSRSVTRRVWS